MKKTFLISTLSAFIALVAVLAVTVKVEAQQTLIRTSGIRTALIAFGDYFKFQKWQTIDDYVNTTGTVGEYTREESVWVTVGTFAGHEALGLSSGLVKRDTRTGLWWTDQSAATMTNVFTLTGVAGVGDGTRPTGGNAIGFCEALNTANFAGKNGWYLPTQKQLMQAYINGAANNLPNPGNNFWSSTEYYNGTAYACGVYLTIGNTYSDTKANRNYVRCVR